MKSIQVKHLLLSLGLCLALAPLANAQQVTTDQGSRSDAINLKIHEVDLLLQLLPLLLTKDQIKDQILPAIEVARSKEKKQLQVEDEALAKMEAGLDQAIKDAYDKGAYPPKTLIDSVASKTGSIGVQRSLVQLDMVSIVTQILEKTLNAGQKKALLNSFDPKFIDPSKKSADLTDEAKMNFFVTRVFLDPMTYDILKKMAAK